MAVFLMKTVFKDQEVLLVMFQGDRKGEGSSKVHDKIEKLVIESGGSLKMPMPFMVRSPASLLEKNILKARLINIFISCFVFNLNQVATAFLWNYLLSAVDLFRYLSKTTYNFN